MSDAIAIDLIGCTAVYCALGDIAALSLSVHLLTTILFTPFTLHTTSDGKLISVGEKIRLPDDVTVGYIIEHMLAKKLTVIDAFHSHLEPMALLPKSSLDGQVS